MNIKATCGTCGRDFLIEQIGVESDAPGRCPFCGARFAKHYSSLLVDAVREVEMAADYFANSLGRLEELETGFRLHLDELFDELSERVGRPGVTRPG